MKVSVVVPVYNPGRYIADLIDSLQGQSLAASEFEVVFVDDGSTDGTPALLDRATAAAPNMRVIHIPNSGWPGTPRNVGIDAALGDYVFLSDHDDRLDPQALERLTSFADEHASDVVVGRIVGVGRNAPTRIFARTVVDAQRDPGLLMTSLTPQKLYRRAFLNERGIRFPEGRRRLEDHLFVTKAYLRARRVSIYADHPVYYFVIRDDGQNASRHPVEWRGYFENAAESIAVVDAEAPDEATRVTMRSRWLRTEALARVRGSAFVNRRVGRDVLVEAVRDLLQRHYPLAEIDRLTPADRIAARLVLAGRDDELLAFAEWEASLRVRPVLETVRVDDATGTVHLAIAAEQRATVPRPLVLLDPPADWPAGGEVDALEQVPHAAGATVRLRHPGTGTVLAPEVQQSVEHGVLRVSARFDLAGATLPDGRWTVQVTMRGIGKVRGAPLTVPAERRERLKDAVTRIDGRTVRLLSDGTRLALRVDSPRGRSPLSRVVRALRRVLTPPRRLIRMLRRAS